MYRSLLSICVLVSAIIRWASEVEAFVTSSSLLLSTTTIASSSSVNDMLPHHICKQSSSSCCSYTTSSLSNSYHHDHDRYNSRYTVIVMMGGSKLSKLERKAKKKLMGGDVAPKEYDGALQIGKLKAKELQKQAEPLAKTLLEEVAKEKRDAKAINDIFEELKKINKEGQGSLKLAASPLLMKDWKLVYVDSDEAITAVGTGLHKLPLTRIEAMFMRLKSLGMRDTVETLEVLRVLGPFPNVRNVLSGPLQKVSANKLNLAYNQMIDGTGKVSTGSSDKVKKMEVEVLYVGASAMVLLAEGKRQLVFQVENDIDNELEKLRVGG